MFKKFLISVILSIFLLTSFFVPIAKAEQTGSWYQQGFGQWYKKVYDSPESEIFGERYTAAQVQWVIYSFWAFLINSAFGNNTGLGNCMVGAFTGDGIDGNACGSGVGDSFKNLLTVNPTGVPIASAGPLISQVFKERNFSGIGYVKDNLSKFHLIPEVRAQQEGFGFSALGPIQPLWRAVRNMSFFIFVLMIVVFSFMIMFRVKIAPQIVIGVQSAIPKLAIALILVTFSYAIAGFMVDLMYVVIGIVSMMFNLGGSYISSTTNFLFITGELPIVSGLGILGYFGIYLFFFVGMLAISLGALAITKPILAVVFGLLSIIGVIVLIIVFIWNTFKTLWMLVKTLAKIYLLVILAPLQLTLGAVVPSLGFGAWVKSLAGALAVFPVVGALLLLAFTFLFYSLGLSGEVVANLGITGAIFDLVEAAFGIKIDFLPGNLWSPPLLGIGAAGAPLLFVLVSLVILLMIPKAAELIQSAIEGKPFAFGTAIGEAIVPINAAWNYGPLRTARGIVSERSAGNILVSVGDRLAASRSRTIGNLGTQISNAGQSTIDKLTP